jgi:hypothetical protein
VNAGPTFGLVQSAWLFTRGSDSVRMVRVTHPKQPTRLLVNGPGEEAMVHVVDEPMDVARLQSELERRLVIRGYHLAQFMSGERRSGRDRRLAPRAAERRRDLRRVV